MHHFRNKKGNMGLMAINIDMAKAYDSVEWGVLQKILEMLEFNEIIVNLIMECTTPSSFSILLNGSLTSYFSAGKGLRQRDPASPFLFTISLLFVSDFT